MTTTQQQEIINPRTITLSLEDWDDIQHALRFARRLGCQAIVAPDRLAKALFEQEN